MTTYVIIIIVVALLFDFLNGFLAQQKSNGAYKQLQSKWLKITFDDLPSQPLLPGDRPVK